MVYITPSDRLIVALDVDTETEAISLADQLGDAVSFYKVGLQLFLGGEGRKIIEQLCNRHKKIFLDLKIEDVPETVESAIRNMEDIGIHFFTIKGNDATTRAALRGRGNNALPKFLQLTVLSSWNQDDLNEYYGAGEPNAPQVPLERFVNYWAKKVLDAGCDGLIASGASIKQLRAEFGNKPIIVAPGIRPQGTNNDDHKRALTPYQAILDGADYLVVGRPIKNSENPLKVVENIIEQITSALVDGAEARARARNMHSFFPQGSRFATADVTRE
jgi:orotidine-5'-phosphate decarboxylase